jgi:hypothetical protein
VVKNVTGTRATLSAPWGRVSEYGVRGVDSQGRTGPIRGLVRTTRPVPASDWTFLSTWGRVRDPDFYTDGAYGTVTRGARIKIGNVRDITEVRLMVPTSPGQGRVEVYVGARKVGTVSTASSSPVDQKVLVVRLGTTMGGTVTLKAIDAGKRVRVSGIGFARG